MTAFPAREGEKYLEEIKKEVFNKMILKVFLSRRR
jgi:hypothetical protein